MRNSLILQVIQLMFKQLERLYNLTLHQAALEYLGTDPTPQDRIDDVLACASSLSKVIQRVIPSFPHIPGTWTLDDYLKNSPRFKRVTVPMPGNIIIAATGTGNSSIRGHCGIVGQRGLVMSNDSDTGKWMANYTIDSFMARYRDKGGMPVKFYSLVK